MRVSAYLKRQNWERYKARDGSVREGVIDAEASLGPMGAPNSAVIPALILRYEEFRTRMTHAVNKLAAWLAAVAVACMVLLVSSAAQAHVSHDGKSFGSLTAQVLAVRAADADRPLPAVKSAAQDASVWIADPGGKTDDALPSDCCGQGVSACSAGTLAQEPSVLLRSQSSATDDPFGTAALIGVTVDGLIRPPRASV